MFRYSIIIPAWNEAHTIARAVRETSALLAELEGSSEIIVVDDGSADETHTIVTGLSNEMPSNVSLRCLRLTHNQGKGAALQAGVSVAQGTYVAFLDADLATRPKELRQGFALLETADIAIGSRRVPQASIQKPQTQLRSLAGQCFNLIVRLWLNLPYRDTQCGCKAFRADVAKRLFGELTTTGWAFDVELLCRARELSYRIVEFPVLWTNGPVSRVRLRDTWQIMRDLMRIKHRDS